MIHEIHRRVLALCYMNSAPEFMFESLSIAKKLPPPDELTTVGLFQPKTCGFDISIASALGYAITNTNKLGN